MYSHIWWQDGWFLEHTSSQEPLLVHHNFLVIFVSITFFALSTLLEIVQCWKPLSSIVKTLMTFHYINWLYFFWDPYISCLYNPHILIYLGNIMSYIKPPTRGEMNTGTSNLKLFPGALWAHPYLGNLIHGPPWPTPPHENYPHQKNEGFISGL